MAVEGKLTERSQVNQDLVVMHNVFRCGQNVWLSFTIIIILVVLSLIDERHAPVQCMQLVTISRLHDIVYSLHPPSEAPGPFDVVRLTG